MRYLVKTVETYRADTEAEAQGLITEAQQANEYELIKYASEHKEVKAKGDVIDDYYKVSIVKGFTSEKEPETQVTISYEI